MLAAVGSCAIALLFAVFCWWGFSAVKWRRGIHKLVGAVRKVTPGALITSAQVGAVTHRALRRIGRADDISFGETGPYYALVAEPGSLRLVRGGSSAEIVAEFPAARIRDVRVGKTSWVYADYTTLFFGIRAETTTYELPIRVNGPREESMSPATLEWAETRAARIMHTVQEGHGEGSSI